MSTPSTLDAEAQSLEAPALVLDPRARVLNDGATVVGGDPPRVLRLTPAGAAVARQLLAGVSPGTPVQTLLAARLIAAGIAHPRPAPVPVGSVTIVVPVRDRPAELDRCLASTGGVPAIVVDDGSVAAAAIAAVCARHGARLIRRPAPGGPAAARNAALVHVDTELVAFLDSDCIADEGWLELLCGVLADPQVGAVAPRIRPLPRACAGGTPAGPCRPGAIARFGAARSPLDLGPHPARVYPGGRVAYVPTAALLARRAALGDGFDPGLRYGEDVDLVWQMHDAGWVVRYEPAAVVGHAEPEKLALLARRRFAYGSAAGPLARRHPGRLAPVRLDPRPVAVLGLAAAGRPRLAAGAAAIHIALTARSLRRAGVPLAAASTLALRGVGDSSAAIGRAATMLAPGLLLAELMHPRSRPAALSLLLAEPARSWTRARPGLDPVRWSALAIVDDVAYGAGVWVGALRARTIRPLTPVLPSQGFWWPSRRTWSLIRSVSKSASHGSGLQAD